MLFWWGILKPNINIIVLAFRIQSEIVSVMLDFCYVSERSRRGRVIIFIFDFLYIIFMITPFEMMFIFILIVFWVLFLVGLSITWLLFVIQIIFGGIKLHLRDISAFEINMDLIVRRIIIVFSRMIKGHLLWIYLRTDRLEIEAWKVSLLVTLFTLIIWPKGSFKDIPLVSFMAAIVKRLFALRLSLLVQLMRYLNSKMLRLLLLSWLTTLELPVIRPLLKVRGCHICHLDFLLYMRILFSFYELIQEFSHLSILEGSCLTTAHILVILWAPMRIQSRCVLLVHFVLSCAILRLDFLSSLHHFISSAITILIILFFVNVIKGDLVRGLIMLIHQLCRGVSLRMLYESVYWILQPHRILEVLWLLLGVLLFQVFIE